eukprot:c31244_g1_i1 orf=2-232(-)
MWLPGQPQELAGGGWLVAHRAPGTANNQRSASAQQSMSVGLLVMCQAFQLHATVQTLLLKFTPLCARKSGSVFFSGG